MTTQTNAQRPIKLRPIMLLPGLLAWGLIIPGIIMEDQVLITLGAALIAVTILVRVVKMMRTSSAAKQERKRVWETGRRATARILSIGTNGGGINDHPKVNFELEVMLEAGVTYNTRTSAIISNLAIPRIQPECQIEVRVDRQDRNVVIVDEKLTPYGYN